jgi:hypothetical protein
LRQGFLIGSLGYANSAHGASSSAIFEDVFGAARPIQRHEYILDVTEIVLREPVDVVGRAFGFSNLVVELGNPFLGYALFAKGIVDERHQVAIPSRAIACSQPAHA